MDGRAISGRRTAVIDMLIAEANARKKLQEVHLLVLSWKEGKCEQEDEVGGVLCRVPSRCELEARRSG
ncbi:hypothetical protein ZWY2020_002754 [Hordeum vulgare]|nr:hypothetical protein ZWY2020_002754 [Hordeum vulgare]